MLAQEDQEIMMLIKGKRSKRPRPTSSLTMMSTTSTTSSTTSSPLNSIGEYREEEEVPHHEQGHREDIEEEDMANCLILLAKGQNPNKPIIATSSSSNPPENVSYQCKTCSKSFSSFQALGGHRASHKYPNKDRSSTARDRENPCDDYDRSVILSLQMSSHHQVDLNGNPNSYNSTNVHKKSSRVHECSICGAEFVSGQALGGHMRRHRAVPPAAGGGGESNKRPRNLLALDLNLPAPEDQDCKFAFVPKEQVIAFSASSLVDCLY